MRTFAFISALCILGAAADELISRSFPHLIVPVSQLEPDKPFNTQASFDVEHKIWTEMSFDIPSNGASRCALSFHISVDPTRGAPWKLWGVPPFIFNISTLPNEINKDTDTWNHRPQPLEHVASIEVHYWGEPIVYDGVVPCAKGQLAQFLLYPADPNRDFGLTWYELTDPLHGVTYDMYA